MSFNYDPSAYSADTNPQSSVSKGDFLTVISMVVNFVAAGIRKNGTSHNAFFNFLLETEEGLSIRSCINIVPKERRDGSVETDEGMTKRINSFLSHLQKAAFGGPVVKVKNASTATLCERMSEMDMTPFGITITGVNPKSGICNFFVGEAEVSKDEDTQEDNGSSDTETSDFPQAK